VVKLEVFSGDPPCPGCIAIIDLAERIYAGADAMEKFEEYKLFCVPAAVINGTIRIEGMCPSEATLYNALREGGLCLK
jgi:hypothetical protein